MTLEHNYEYSFEGHYRHFKIKRGQFCFIILYLINYERMRIYIIPSLQIPTNPHQFILFLIN